jgi:hypothetical protein
MAAICAKRAACVDVKRTVTARGLGRLSWAAALRSTGETNDHSAAASSRPAISELTPQQVAGNSPGFRAAPSGRAVWSRALGDLGAGLSSPIGLRQAGLGAPRGACRMTALARAPCSASPDAAERRQVLTTSSERVNDL